MSSTGDRGQYLREEDRDRWAHLPPDMQMMATYLWRKYGMTDEQMAAYQASLTPERRAIQAKNARWFAGLDEGGDGGT